MCKCSMLADVHQKRLTCSCLREKKVPIHKLNNMQISFYHSDHTLPLGFGGVTINQCQIEMSKSIHIALIMQFVVNRSDKYILFLHGILRVFNLEEVLSEKN